MNGQALTGFRSAAVLVGLVALFAPALRAGADSPAAGQPSQLLRPVAGILPDHVDETVVLDGTKANHEHGLRVHLEGPHGLSSVAFTQVPDRRRFSRLPVSGKGGFGAALRKEPFMAAAVWLSFSTYNQTKDEQWALVADGVGFRPVALVLVSEDGSSQHFSGEALERLHIHTGLPDMAAYVLRQQSGQRQTVYFRLDGGASFGPGLSLWQADALHARAVSITGLSSALAGFTLAVCLAYALASTMPQRAFARAGVARKGAAGARASQAGTARERAGAYALTGLRFAYPALVACAVLAGRNGGAISALLGGVGTVRYAATVASAALALAAESCIAFMVAMHDSGSAARLDRKQIARIALPRIALAAVSGAAAFSTRSPLDSFLLPVALCVLVTLSAVVEVVTQARWVTGRLEEAERHAARLEVEAKGGRDFMTATAAALRGPLHGLMGILENLDTIESSSPKVPRTAGSDLPLARAEAARLDNLVSNILSYSGLGPSRLAMEHFDLASLARSVAALLRVALAGHKASIEVRAPIIEIRSDISFVHRLLYTAMNRAARTAGAGSVRVSASSSESMVIVVVEDDGEAPHESTPGDSPVPDMELVVMGRLAKLLGGTFATGRTEGVNLHVLEIPRMVPAGVEELTAEPRGGVLFGVEPVDAEFVISGPPGRVAGRVLVAGNEPVALIATKHRLESSFWLVDATVSSQDALGRVLGGEPYDIVIIDSAMPGMSGFEFCELVRASHVSESVPIIVLTEAGRTDEIERALRSGANDYIQRPASGIELEARVRTHVDLASSVKRELSQVSRMAEFDKYRTLAMLSAGVAHEINTPNNAILRNVPMLKEIWSNLETAIDRIHREEGGFSVRGFGYEDLKREVPDMLNDLYMGAQDIKKIVEGLKDYARAASATEVPGLVDANECLRYAARLLKHSIAVATDHFEMVLADDLPVVHADRLKLTQVVVNVLENAIQALPDRHHGVRMATSIDVDANGLKSVVIRVADDGIGMSPETLSQVFEPFFTTKRDRGGSGLGLAVASGIIRDLGGTIQLRSNQGEGTLALILIPAGSRNEDVHDGR